MTCNCDYCQYLAGDKAAAERVAKEIGERAVRQVVFDALSNPQALDRLLNAISVKLKQRGLL